MAEGTEDRGTEQDGAGVASEQRATPAHEERGAIEHTRLLVELFLCEEAELDSYRAQWLPPGSPASQEHLRAARLLLHRLAQVLQATGTEGWSRLAGLAAALEGVVPSQALAGAGPTPAPIAPPPVEPRLSKQTMMDGSAAEAVSWARDAAATGAAPPPAPPPLVGEAYRAGSGPPLDPPAPGPVPSGPPAMANGASPAPPPLVPDGAGGSPHALPVMSESAAPPTAKDAYPPVPAVVPPPKPPPPSRQSSPGPPAGPPSPPPAAADGVAAPEPGRSSEAPAGPPPAGPYPSPPPPPSGHTAVSPGAVPPDPDGPSAPASPAERPAWPAAEPADDEATQLHSGEELAAPGGPAEDEDELQETVAVETMSPLKQVLAAGPEATNLPDLTLQQYASLCAEREVRPADVVMTRQKYGIPDEATHQALDAHWERLFDAQPSVRERLQGLVTEYVAWLRHQG